MQLLRLSRFFFIFFLFCSNSAQSAPRWWDKFVSAITSAFTPVTTPTYYFGDPNNTGINGGWTHTPNYMSFLPPYNRKVGRGSLGTEPNCLYQFPLPGESGNTTRNAFGTITNMCAEDPGNNAVKSKIKIRNVTCLFAGCFYQQFELNALKSECKFTVGLPLGSMQYILPFVTRRVCARIASPPGDGYPADPGYMQGTDSAGRARGQHLDNYGVKQWDDLVTDQDNNQYAIFRPKICAYDDPWALDIWISGDKAVSSKLTAMQNLIDGKGSLSDFLQVPLDIFDLNPLAQPFHSGFGVSSPVANLLITLLQLYITYQTIGPQIMQSIVLMLVSSIKSPGVDTAAEVLSTIYKIANFILTYQASTILLILQANSQVNKYSYSNYGCVNLPLGDYPPNYCPTSASIVTGLLDAICSTDSSGNLYQNCYGSTTTQTDQTTPYTLCTPTKCVQSNYDNNFFNNTVRIGYTHPVQVCSSSLTSNCVNISASLTRTSAMQNNNFVLGSGLSLVNVGNATISSTKQYRVLYQVLNAAQTNLIEVSNYSYVDLPDCGSSTNGYSSPTGASVAQSTQFCQSIWGVDLGEYSDSFTISVTPTTTSPTGPLSTSSNPISLSYTDLYSGRSFNNKFYVQIDQHTEDYENICAYQMYDLYPDSQIGCLLRPSMPKASIASCSSSTHTSPCATINWSMQGKTGTNYTASTTMTVPQFTSDWSSLPSDPVIYIGGAKFSTHVVDTNNLTVPYQPSSSSDSRIVNLSGTIYYNSMWGTYLNSIMPSSSCDQDSCAVYLNGLEYIGGHYVRGGSYLCIDNLNGCEGDTTQCILANNYTSPDGSTTWTSISPNDRVNPNTTSTTLTPAEYYEYDETASIPEGQSVRSKIGLENSSMCVTIPPATCSASTDADAYYSDWSSGTPYYYRATWPASSSSGQLATGTCSLNYIAVDSSKMGRYCLLKSTGTTYWDTDNTRIATTFSGCAPSCITNVSTSYTSNAVNGGTITSTNTTATKSADGGTILIYTPGGVGSNGIVQTSGTATNTVTISFNISSANNSDATKSDIYFTNLQFDDYIRVFVTNGSNVTTQITTDSNTIANSSNTSFPLWQSTDTEVGGWRNYSTLDTNLSNLNATLLNALSSGNNTITITTKTIGGGGFYIGMKYNQLCYTQCSAVTSASSTTGNATWTKAAVGAISAGTCATGYTTLDSSKMTRGCTLSGASGILDTITNGTSQNTSMGTQFSGCSPLICSSETSGNAYWAATSYGSSVTGQCNSGYSPVDLSKMTRACSRVVGTSVAFDTMASDGTSTSFAGCTLSACISSVTASALTQNSTSGGNNTATITGIDSSSGSIIMQTPNGVSNTNGIYTSSSSGATNSFSTTFNVTDTSLALIHFGALRMNDFLRVSVINSAGTTQITSDTAQVPVVLGGTTYDLWSTSSSPSDLGDWRYYNSNYDRSLVNINNALKAALRTGSNTIKIDVKTIGGGGLYSSLKYYTGCTKSCVSDGAGNATWFIAPVGSSSDGTCNIGYVANNSAKMTRTCTYNSSGNAVLETVQSSGTTSSGNFAGCTLATCAGETYSNATWGSATYGSTSTGACNSGYSATNSNAMTRTCTLVNGSVAFSDTNFGGCTADRISNITISGDNNNGSIDGSAWWSGTDYYVQFRSTNGWGNNGIFVNSGVVTNYLYLSFYVPTSNARTTVSINTLQFDDYVRIYTENSYGSNSWTQVSADAWSINGKSLYSTGTSDVGGWRDFYSQGGTFAYLHTEGNNFNGGIWGNLRVGWNRIRAELRTIRGGGIVLIYKFSNPS